jgi:hypothetical protein
MTRPTPWSHRAFSQALIVIMAWLSVAPALHSGGDDPDCAPSVIVHDASQHRIGTDTVSRAGEPFGDHCLACHFFRLSRDTAVWRFVPQVLAQQTRWFDPASTLIHSLFVLPVPARAPPVQI